MEDTLIAWKHSTFAILAAVLILAVYVIYLWVFKKSDRKLPPGPKGWGTTLEMFRATKNETMTELAYDWARKYGPMVYINYMGRKILLLNSVDITRRLMTSEEYKVIVAGRFPAIPAILSNYGSKDWVFSQYSPIVRKKRRLFHNVIGYYGDGIDKFENVVAGEMDRLLAEISQFENKDVELWRHLARSLKIIIYILAIGERPSDVNTPNILENYDMAYNKLLLPEYDIPLRSFPWLAKIPGKFKNAVDRLKSALIEAEELVYVAPKRTWTPGKPRGIADYLFDLENNPDFEFMKEDNEHTTVFLTNLFWAAHLTSRSAVLGIFLCLVNYPNVTKKLHEEIDRVLGDRRPKLEDKPNMPYTEATILEVLRLVSQTPLGSLRSVSKDIQIDGITIPKDTLILVNFWYFHHNEDIWEDPWVLKPERFLDSQGKLLKSDHPVRRNFLPFGAGLRSCPGENFAKSRLFMFVTYILQKYDILPPSNEKLVPADFRANDEEVKGFILQVRPFKCRLQPRQCKTQ